mgnify:CR=1 FL=1
MKKTVIAFATALASLLAAPGALAQSEIRISSAAPDNSPLSDAFRMIKQRMEAKFPGALKVSVHTASSLFRQGTELPALQRGNLEMASLTPYSGKFAGRRIDAGRLSVDLAYRVKNRQLAGENRFVIQQIKLGERVDSPDAVNLPLITAKERGAGGGFDGMLRTLWMGGLVIAALLLFGVSLTPMAIVGGLVVLREVMARYGLGEPLGGPAGGPRGLPRGPLARVDLGHGRGVRHRSRLRSPGSRRRHRRAP